MFRGRGWNVHTSDVEELPCQLSTGAGRGRDQGCLLELGMGYYYCGCKDASPKKAKAKQRAQHRAHMPASMRCWQKLRVDM